MVSRLSTDLRRALRDSHGAGRRAGEGLGAGTGELAPGAVGSLTLIDIKAAIVIAHSERAGRGDVEEDVPPLAASAGHGAAGTGESPTRPPRHDGQIGSA